MIQLINENAASGFYFDGICSLLYGLEIVNAEGSVMTSLPFVGSQTIEQEAPMNGLWPYLLSSSKKPIEFSMQFALIDQQMTAQKRLELAEWMIKPDYSTLEFCNNRGVIYHVIVTSQADFFCNPNSEGYYTLSFQSMPTNYTVTIDQSFDLGAYPESGHYLSPAVPATVTVQNPCNVLPDYYPYIEITYKGGTGSSLQMTNLSKSAEPFVVTGMSKDEKIMINNQMRTIFNNDGLNLFSRCNKKWLSLQYGSNMIQVNNRAVITFLNQFPVYA